MAGRQVRFLAQSTVLSTQSLFYVAPESPGGEKPEDRKDMRLSHTRKIKTEFALEFFNALENLFQHGLFDAR